MDALEGKSSKPSRQSPVKDTRQSPNEGPQAKSNEGHKISAGPSNQLPPQDLAPPQLWVPEMLSFRPKLINGYAVAPICGQALTSCSRQAQESPEDSLDADYLHLQEYRLTSGANYHLASAVVHGSVLGVQKAALPHKLCRLAAAQWTMNRVGRCALEIQLATSLPSSALIAHCEAFAWDETPLRASMRHNTKLSELDLPNTNCEVGDDGELAAIKRLGAAVRPDSAICKVLQTQQWCGFLVEISGLFFKIVFEQVCPLQVLQRNSAQVLGEAIRQQAGATKSSAHFHFQGRVASFDKAPYNTKAFLALGAERGLQTSMHCHCEAHTVSRSFASSFDGLVGKHVTGLTSCALSLRCSGMLALFRQSLKEEVAERIQVLRGHPPAEAVEHKQLIMATMLSGASKNMPQMTLLALLPSGDWRSNRVQHYIPSTAADPDQATLTQITAKLVSGLCYALVGKKPSVWARHRWTGCEIAVEEIGLMESIHQLLSTSYTRFLQKCEKPRPALAAGGAPPASGAAGSQGALRGQMPEDDFGLRAQGVHAQEAGGIPNTEAGEPDTLTTDDAERDFAAINEAYRRRAQTWLRTQPLDYLYIMRLTMEPLKQLLQRQFHVCSEGWEVSQRAQLAHLLENPVANVPPQRDYMVTLATDGTHERSYFQDVLSLLTNLDAWALVSERRRTVSFNHLCFQILSRGGCMVETNIAHPHRQMPYSLFSLLKQPERAAELSQVPGCCLDLFSAGLLESFPGFEGDRCLQVLELHAMLASTNIAHIESKHSSIRRHAVLKSTHTWAHQVRDLSAAWTLQQFRRGRLHALKLKPGSKAAPALSKTTSKVGRGTAIVASVLAQSV